MGEEKTVTSAFQIQEDLPHDDVGHTNPGARHLEFLDCGDATLMVGGIVIGVGGN